MIWYVTVADVTDSLATGEDIDETPDPVVVEERTYKSRRAVDQFLETFTQGLRQFMVLEDVSTVTGLTFRCEGQRNTDPTRRIYQVDAVSEV